MNLRFEFYLLFILFHSNNFIVNIFINREDFGLTLDEHAISLAIQASQYNNQYKKTFINNNNNSMKKETFKKLDFSSWYESQVLGSNNRTLNSINSNSNANFQSNFDFDINNNVNNNSNNNRKEINSEIFFIIIIIYCLLILINQSIIILIPVWMSLPTSTGGLGYTVPDIGLIISGQ